jgi:hypothetical protein
LKWRNNNLRRRLGREPLAAFWMATGSTTIVELAGAAAPDAFIIDVQHDPCSGRPRGASGILQPGGDPCRDILYLNYRPETPGQSPWSGDHATSRASRVLAH